MIIEVKANSTRQPKLNNPYKPLRVFEIKSYYLCLGEKCESYRSTGGTVWCPEYYAGSCRYPVHAKIKVVSINSSDKLGDNK